MAARRAWLLAAAGAAWATMASAQYTPPGGLGEPIEDAAKQVEAQSKDARWHLGRLALDPRYGLANVSYYRDLSGGTGTATSDTQVGAFAGLAAFAPIGSRSMLAGFALPEYDWWQKSSERRGWIGRYGAGLFGDLSRVQLQAYVRREEAQGYATSELQAPISSTSDTFHGALDLKLGYRLSLFGSYDALRARYGAAPDLPASLPPESLDRDEDTVRGGIRYRSPRGFFVGAGVGSLDVRFTDGSRSSSGSGPVAELGFDGNHLFANVSAQRFKLAPKVGSTMPPYNETDGRAQLGWKARVVTLTLYGGSKLNYSLSAAAVAFREERYGVSLEGKLGNRSSLRVYAEDGSNHYLDTATAAGPKDSFRALGASLQIQVARGLGLVVDVTRQEVGSSQLGAQRATTSLHVGLAVGGTRTPF